MTINWKSGMKSGVLALAVIVAGAACNRPKAPALPQVAPGPLQRPLQLQTVVAIGNDGSQVLAGSFAGRLSIAGKELASEGRTDIFIVKTAADGAPVFGPERFGGPGDDAVTDIAIDGDGNVLLVGTFQGEATFRERKKADVRHRLQRAIFAAKLDAKGKMILWFTQVAVANLPTQVSLAIRPDQKILVGASTTGTITTKQANLTLAGESVMLALLDAANGKLQPPPDGPQYQVRSFVPGCAHSPCKTGVALSAACGLYGCVAAVCDKISLCCSYNWTDQCVTEFMNTCQRRCDCNGVFTDGPPFYPDASPCVSAVYTLGTLGGGIGDTYCSEVWWDGWCIEETNQYNITAVCHPPCQ